MAKRSKPLFDDKEALFIQLISEGGTIRSAAEVMKVNPSTICRWLADPDREEFRKQYARAREAQGDDYADRVIETALDPSILPDEKRIRIDAFKWAAGKRKPRVYSDKSTVLLGEDPEHPFDSVTEIRLTSG